MSENPPWWAWCVECDEPLVKCDHALEHWNRAFENPLVPPELDSDLSDQILDLAESYKRALATERRTVLQLQEQLRQTKEAFTMLEMSQKDARATRDYWKKKHDVLCTHLERLKKPKRIDRQTQGLRYGMLALTICSGALVAAARIVLG